MTDTRNGSLVKEDLQGHLDLGEIVVRDDNVRKDLGDLGSLAESIRANGIIQPVVVTPDHGEGHVLIAGHRRVAAAKLAELEDIPVVIRDVDEATRLELMLVENLQREGLTPLEEASAYQRLVVEHGYSQSRLATRIARSQPHISRRIALLDLPVEVHEALATGALAVTQADELVKLKDHRDRILEILRRPSYTSFEQALRTEIQELDRERLRKAKEKELKDAGVALLPSSIPAGAAKVGHWGAPLRDLDEEAHREEPCRAVRVTAGGYEEEWCLKPDRHVPAGATEAETAESDEARQRRERIEQLEKAQGVRRAFVAGVLADKPPKAADDLIAWCLVVMYEKSYGMDDLIVELLGLDLPEEVTEADDYEGVEQAIAEYASEGTANLRRAALATAATQIEGDHLGVHMYQGWGGRLVDQYWEFLTSQGYLPSSAELTMRSVYAALQKPEDEAPEMAGTTFKPDDEGVCTNCRRVFGGHAGQSCFSKDADLSGLGGDPQMWARNRALAEREADDEGVPDEPSGGPEGETKAPLTVGGVPVEESSFEALDEAFEEGPTDEDLEEQENDPGQDGIL